MTQADFIAEKQELDMRALEPWLREHVKGFSGPVHCTRFKGGQSNPTYLLRTPDRDYVLRRKPPGVVLKGAHAVDREARVMSALYKEGFPVPAVHALCTNDEVIGSWFYVMDKVEGRIFWDAGFGDVPKEKRADYMDAMNATLASLHSMDPERLGLSDYGRAGGYVERQVSRWSEQYLHDDLAGRHPSMDSLVEWLPAHLPQEDTVAVTHGDFRADNMIFHPSEPRVVAVLDWELSTIGHPLADFAYHAMMYRMPSDILGGIAGLDHRSHGLPTEAQYIANYCGRTGRESVADFDYYVAFNMFRFAAILHGIRGRVLRGTAVNADAKAMGDLFPRVADLAWEQARRFGGH